MALVGGQRRGTPGHEPPRHPQFSRCASPHATAPSPRWTVSTSASMPTRCWPSSANRVRASRCRCWRSWACCPGPPRSPPTGWISAGRTCASSAPKARRAIVGRDMAMIFQEPMSSLNPCYTIGFQIKEALQAHLDLSRNRAQGAGGGPAQPGRHPRAGASARHVPAPIVRRHEPARDDRHGAGLQAECC